MGFSPYLPPASFPNTRCYVNYFTFFISYRPFVLLLYIEYSAFAPYSIQIHPPADQQAMTSFIITSIHTIQHLPWLCQAPALCSRNVVLWPCCRSRVESGACTGC